MVAPGARPKLSRALQTDPAASGAAALTSPARVIFHPLFTYTDMPPPPSFSPSFYVHQHAATPQNTPQKATLGVVTVIFRPAPPRGSPDTAERHATNNAEWEEDEESRSVQHI